MSWLLIIVLKLSFSVADLTASRIYVFEAEFLSCWSCCIFPASLFPTYFPAFRCISMWPESSNVYRWWVLTGELRDDVAWPETSATYRWWQISGRLINGEVWPINQRSFWQWFEDNKDDCIICNEERVPVRVCYTVRSRHNIEEYMSVCVRCKKTLWTLNWKGIMQYLW